jgi:hypothetical protein
MKNILWIIAFLLTLSCTEVVEDTDGEQYTILLSTSQISVAVNWYWADIDAFAVAENGDTLSDVSFNWESSDTSAVVVYNGSVSAVSPGVANITAEYEGFISEPCIVTVPTRDSIYAITESDSVKIYHDCSLRNCGLNIAMDVQINGNVITITETNEYGDQALCDCFFDFSVSINELLPGNYTAEIYAIDRPTQPENVDYYGSVEFTIEGNSNQTEPTVGSEFQSECYDLGE